MVGLRSGIAHFLSQMQENGPPLRLHLNSEKCEVFWSSGDSCFPDFPTEISQVKNGVSLLESPAWGRTSYTVDFVSAIVHKASALQQLLGLEDPQVELHFLRSCLNTCKIFHILQTVPPGDVDICLKQFDSNLRSNFSHIIRCPISDLAWSQATLPLRLGGLDLRESLRTSSAAYYTSCFSSIALVSELVHTSSSLRSNLTQQVGCLVLLGEASALSTISELLPEFTFPEESISQKSIQGSLDRAFYSLLVSCSHLRDRARLNTMGESGSSCPSAWLQAIPQSSLGLSLPASEFIVAARYWLRNSFF